MRFAGFAGGDREEAHGHGLGVQEINAPVGRHHADEVRLLQELLVGNDSALPGALQSRAHVLAVQLEDDPRVLEEVLAENEELEATRAGTGRQRLFAYLRDSWWLSY